MRQTIMVRCHMHPASQKLYCAWSYIWKNSLLAWVPSVFVWYIVHNIYPGLSEFDVFSSPASALFIACILAPFLETQGMRIVIFLLAKVTTNDSRIAVYSAAVW